PEALAQLYALIARQLHSEYGLRYRSPNPRRDGTRRAVSVRLRSSGGTLEAHGWYQAPGAGSSVIALGPPAASGTPAPALPGEPLPTVVGSPTSLTTTMLRLLAAAILAGAAVVAVLLARGRSLRGSRISELGLNKDEQD